MKKRSLGVTLLGWFEILLGGGGILFTLFWMMCAVWYWFGLNVNNMFDLILIISLIFFRLGIIPVFLIISGIGIVKRKVWIFNYNNYIVSISFFVYLIIRIFIWKWVSQWENVISNLQYIFFCIMFHLVIIYAIKRPKIKAQFFTNKPDINANHSKEENAV